ncbi:hypothetical protein [Nocardia sp. XZ_19_385]|uniref:hypothetical protein n=1 Tax=Nocardia sp. XZ_19_385 TaxID=2769488 RepID=UPI00188FFBCD|nr:hypothetical protein [Nocardia sp. XZ_19_385]
MSVLTNGIKTSPYLEEMRGEASRQVDAIVHGRLVRDLLDELTDEIWNEFHVERIELLTSQLTVLPTQATQAGNLSAGRKVVISNELMTTFRLPYTGSRDLWRTVPKGELQVVGNDDPLAPVVVGGDDHLLIHVRATDRQWGEIVNDREQTIRALQTKIAWLNEEVDAHNQDLRAVVREQLLRRIEMVEHAAALDAESDVPIYRTPAQEQVPIPIERKILRPAVPNDAAPAGHHEPTMAREIYEDVVQTIEQMTLAMERTPTAAKLDEEEIRNLILIVLNANYRGAVAGEVFNGNGKTDILLRWEGANAFIGECKFWDGQKAFCEAIDQLFGYVTWRDTKAALIIFIRGGVPTEIMKKAKKALHDHCSVESERAGSSTTRGDFVLRSPQDPEQLVTVAVIGVVLPAPATAKS